VNCLSLAPFDITFEVGMCRHNYSELPLSCTIRHHFRGWHVHRVHCLNWRNVAFGIFNGLVFASAGPIIDIKLVTGINWTTFQHTRPNQWAKHWQRSLDTANLLDSVSIVKPCCTSRKAETINSPLSAKDTWLLLASSHRALFGS
jgi:hypothetical protein